MHWNVAHIQQKMLKSWILNLQSSGAIIWGWWVEGKHDVTHDPCDPSKKSDPFDAFTIALITIDWWMNECMYVPRTKLGLSHIHTAYTLTLVDARTTTYVTAVVHISDMRARSVRPAKTGGRMKMAKIPWDVGRDGLSWGLVEVWGEGEVETQKILFGGGRGYVDYFKDIRQGALQSGARRVRLLCWLLPERDYVTFEYLLSQIRLSSAVVHNVRAPFSAGWNFSQCF